MTNCSVAWAQIRSNKIKWLVKDEIDEAFLLSLFLLRANDIIYWFFFSFLIHFLIETISKIQKYIYILQLSNFRLSSLKQFFFFNLDKKFSTFFQILSFLIIHLCNQVTFYLWNILLDNNSQYQYTIKSSDKKILFDPFQNYSPYFPILSKEILWSKKKKKNLEWKKKKEKWEQRRINGEISSFKFF